jgi:GDPmannose 4,6-dehydratase
MSHVKVSFEVPEYTAQTDAVGTLRILEAIRNSGIERKTRFYQASTSEMFGKVQEVPQKETTPFYPRSPYGVAKLYSHWIVKNYRESYGMFACSGILFNHESERRGETFVTRKITIGLSNILKGKQDCLYLGNLNAKRDWGHAQDYVYGMWLMLQQDTPDDYVLSTNEFHSVREFVEKAFFKKGISIEWIGDGIDEMGVDSDTGRVLIRVSEKYFRPAEVDELLGDSTKAREKLGWMPEIGFNELVERMVESDTSA